MGNTLVALGAAFLAAGAFARFGRRLGLPTIPLFMIAGIIFGPHTPGIALVEDPADVELLAVLGLVMLLFNLGLEFSLDDLVGGGRRLLGIGAVYLALNIGGGLLFGFALGWGSREALVIAGAVGISSSAIVTKLLTELHRLANRESRLILGIVVVEDVFLALYLALLQPVIGDAHGALQIAGQFLLAFGFLVAMGALARFGAGLVGRLFAGTDDELLTVCFVGVAVLGAGVAEELGVSDAIGAFMVGLVFAGSAARARVERLVVPLRDAFGSVFFFAFGLTIDPGAVGTVVAPVMVAIVLSVVLNVGAGVIAARMFRYGRVEAANVGFTVLGRGELSLVVASLAASAGLDARIGPFVALYVLALALLAPVLAARAPSLSRWLPARLLVARSADADADADGS
jgi:CPA2 family monovalent cation:H+ antiporter-2